jgi:hypothetical protein
VQHVDAVMVVLKRHGFEVEFATAGVPSTHRLADCEAVVRRSYPHHSALGVAPDAPFDVITAAFRALARAWHPDATGCNTNGRMASLNESWSFLKRTMVTAPTGVSF